MDLTADWNLKRVSILEDRSTELLVLLVRTGSSEGLDLFVKQQLRIMWHMSWQMKSPRKESRLGTRIMLM